MRFRVRGLVRYNRQDNGGRQFARMRQGNTERDALFGGDCGGATVQAQPWSLAPTSSDLDLPQRQGPRAQRLHGRLLGGEAGGEVTGGTASRACVGTLAVGEQPLCERRPTLQSLF